MHELQQIIIHLLHVCDEQSMRSPRIDFQHGPGYPSGGAPTSYLQRRRHIPVALENQHGSVDLRQIRSKIGCDEDAIGGNADRDRRP